MGGEAGGGDLAVCDIGLFVWLWGFSGHDCFHRAPYVFWFLNIFSFHNLNKQGTGRISCRYR
ncbi:MAG: hypothetical protein WC935_03860 [Thermoleophilia bacterium]